MKQPARSAYWLRPFAIDVRGLSAMRIMLGTVLLYDAISRFKMLRVFYTDDGLSPRELFLTGTQKWMSFFSISGSYSLAVTLLSIHALLACLFLIGYRTRVVAILLCASLWSLINRNPTLSHGGNNLAVWLLIWSILVPANVVGAVDSHTARIRPKSRRVASLATVGLLLQVAFVYWLAFAAKTDEDWRSDFTAVYYFLNCHLATPLGHALGQQQVATRILTFASLGLELFGPILALLTFSMPRTRMAIVLSFVMFHLGLVATMYVGTFSFICIAAWLIYVPTKYWDNSRVSSCRAISRIWNRLVSACARAVETIHLAPQRTISPGPTRPFAIGFAGFLLAYVCLVNVVNALPAPIAGLVGPLKQLPRLKQNWGMIDATWRYFHVIILEIELMDGTRRQLRAVDMPRGDFDQSLPYASRVEDYWTLPTWRAETTWTVSYRAMMFVGAIGDDRSAMVAYCDYHRRKWNESHPDPAQQVKSLTVYADISATEGPGGLVNSVARSGRITLYNWPAHAARKRL